MGDGLTPEALAELEALAKKALAEYTPAGKEWVRSCASSGFALLRLAALASPDVVLALCEAARYAERLDQAFLDMPADGLRLDIGDLAAAYERVRKLEADLTREREARERAERELARQRALSSQGPCDDCGLPGGWHRDWCSNADPTPADAATRRARGEGGHCIPEGVNVFRTPGGKPPEGWPSEDDDPADAEEG